MKHFILLLFMCLFALTINAQDFVTQEEAKMFLMNKKVCTKNKSKEIQEKLFELGFEWNDPNDGTTIRQNKCFLFLHEDLKITYIDEKDFFDKHSYKEISDEDILNIKVNNLPKSWETILYQYYTINEGVKPYNNY